MEPYASIGNLQRMPVYQLSRQLGRLVWEIVSRFNYLSTKTIGSQWISATDSISANVAEGYGRFFFKDTIKFYYYSRGSCYESYDWFQKAKERNLLIEEDIANFERLFSRIPIELNKLIKLTGDNARRYGRNKK